MYRKNLTSIFRGYAALFMFVIVFTTGCKQNEIRLFLANADRLAVSISALTDVKQDLSRRNDISREEELRITEFLLKLNDANRKFAGKVSEIKRRVEIEQKQADERGEKIDATKIPESVRHELKPLLNDTLSLLRDLNDTRILGIKNPKSVEAFNQIVSNAIATSNTLFDIL